MANPPLLSSLVVKLTSGSSHSNQNQHFRCTAQEACSCEQLDYLEEELKKTEDEAQSGDQLVKILEAELAGGLEEFDAKREQTDGYRAKTNHWSQRSPSSTIGVLKQRWRSEVGILGKVASEIDGELIRRKIKKDAAECGGLGAMTASADPVVGIMRPECEAFGVDAARARDEM